MQLGTRTPRKFKPEDIRLYTAIGNQLGIAVQKSKLHETTLNLESANKVKDEFLSIMSHELRTPLNVMMGYTGLLRDGILGILLRSKTMP